MNSVDNDYGRQGANFPTMAAALAYYSDYIGPTPAANPRTRNYLLNLHTARVAKFVEYKIENHEITIGEPTPCEN